MQSRCEIYQKLLSSRIIPLFYHDDEVFSLELVNLLSENGFSGVEFTNRGRNARKVVSYLVKKKPKNSILGIGSVMDAGLASHYIHEGADFLVSPGLNSDIFTLANQYKVPYLAGVGSVSEIEKAHRLGAEIVKLFPGDAVGGPGFIKAVKGPIPFAQIMPTGGVGLEKESIQSWFDAGACCMGMGSALISKSILMNKDIEELNKKVLILKKILAEI